MKRYMLSLMLAVGLTATVTVASRADHTNRPEILRAIRTGSEAIKRDAAIYQRRRVNASVAHLVQDTRTLQQALTKDVCLKQDAEALAKAVTVLRAVSQESNPDTTKAAVQKVVELTTQIYEKNCCADPTHHHQMN